MHTETIMVRHVTKEFTRGIRVLDDVSFDLAGDCIVGLVGPNGAGKTTLINAVMGFIFPTDGDIEIFGNKPRYSFSRIGFVAERPNYHKNFSAYRLLTYLAAMRGIEKSRRRRICEEALSKVGLAEASGRPLWKMSKGMLQRFSIAQSLLHDPDLLILDEPMSGLDPLGQKEFREIIAGLKRPGRTIIISSHLLFHLEKICENILLLNRGALKYHGKIAADLGATQTTIRIAESLNAQQVEWLTDAGAVVSEDIVRTNNDRSLIKTILRFLIDQDIDIVEVVKDEVSLEKLFAEKLRT